MERVSLDVEACSNRVLASGCSSTDLGTHRRPEQSKNIGGRFHSRC